MQLTTVSIVGRRTGLRHLVADIVDEVFVAALAADHAVGAGAAISGNRRRHCRSACRCRGRPCRSLSPALPVILLAERIADAGAIGRSRAASGSRRSPRG